MSTQEILGWVKAIQDLWGFTPFISTVILIAIALWAYRRFFSGGD